MAEPKYISVSDAADIVGCSDQRIRQLAAEDKLGTSYKLGPRSWAISRASAKKEAKRPSGGKGYPRGRPRTSPS